MKFIDNRQIGIPLYIYCVFYSSLHSIILDNANQSVLNRHKSIGQLINF